MAKLKSKLKCGCCKVETDRELLKVAPMVDGSMPTSKNAKKYCPACYEDEIYRRHLVDFYYNLYGRKIVPALITSRISSLKKISGLSYLQIYYTTKYLLEIQNVPFDDDFILLIQSACWKAMRYYSQVHKLKNAKKYESIDVITIDQSKKPAHKPNKANIKMTSMDSV
ncbi:hypothetical protein [Terrisporobacter sp.]|uniref:hypothetical protein n=1 Tax=Terrisporobacter sp. TaxID=1965305 RepID=UPI0039951013